MSASSLVAASMATGSNIESGSSSTMSSPSTTTDAIAQATSIDKQSDDNESVNDESLSVKGGSSDDDIILVHTKSPELTLPKPSLITSLESSFASGEDTKSWLNTPLIKLSSNTTVDTKTQLKSINNIVQSSKSPPNNNNINACNSSNKTETTETATSSPTATITTTSANNLPVATSSDRVTVALNAPKIVSTPKTQKNYFKDPTIIKSSSGHHYNNGCLTKPLVINHSQVVVHQPNNVANHQNDHQLQPLIHPSLSSQLIFSSIITSTQAKSLSSVQAPQRANIIPQQHHANLFSASKTTKLVMSNRSTQSSPLSLSSSTTTSSSSSSPITSSPSTIITYNDSNKTNSANKLNGPSSNASGFISNPTTPLGGGQAVSAKLLDMGKRLLDASREGQTDQVRQLVVNSGAPFTSDWLGTTALHLAAQNGHFEIAEILLRGGVNRDARTKLERTALHLAAQGGWLRVVDLLLIHGSDVNVRDMLKMTPLHWAVERNHVAIVERLLISGADTNAKSKFQLTPIDIARNSQSYEMMELFRNWIHNSGNNLVSYVGLNGINNLTSESHEMLDDDYHQHLNLDNVDNVTAITQNRHSVLDIDEPCIDLVELEWNSLKFEPDFFLSNDEEDEPNVGYLMKIVEELQKENRQLRQRVEQLSTTSQ